MVGRLTLILLTILISACASLDYEDYRQTVLITSDPPGVKVYQGKRFLGVTPAYVRVRRGHSPRLNFVPPDGDSREVKLKTEYRWKNSGALNLVLLPLAPAGWLTDIATGTSWKALDPATQVFGKGGEWPAKREPRLVAVAPPSTEDPEISDGLGAAIDDKLRKNARFKVLDYDATAPTFQFYQAAGGPPADKENRYRLNGELKVDHILYSTTERSGDSFQVKSQLRDIVTGRTDGEYAFTVTPKETLRPEFSRRNFFSRYFGLIPNTVFLNFSGYTPQVTVNGVEYEGKEGEAKSKVDEFLHYVNAVSISTLRRPMANVRNQWTFGFVPAVVLSKKTIEFNQYAAVAGVQFERLYASAGYGFEGGYLSRHGFFYADFIPTATWSQLSYTALNQEGTKARTSIQSIIEFGFNKFISEHFVGKIFLRNVGEDAELWSRTLTEVTGQPQYAENVGSVFAGLAVGYHFPSSVKSKKDWSVREARD
jgi:hypothetical protein